MVFGLIALVLVLVVAWISMLNSLIKKKNNVESAFASLDTALKKRHVLVHDWIEILESLDIDEKDFLLEVTNRRMEAMNPNLTVNQRLAAENDLSQSVGELILVLARYPETKADNMLRQIQNSMNEVDFVIATARKQYNAKVIVLNNAIEMFPTKWVAKFMGLSGKPFFDMVQE